MNTLRYRLAFGMLGLIYVCNLGIEVMEIDAAQYASISMEMSQTGSYLEVYHRGDDYLDKPPLLFWLSASLFQLVGISTVAYKIPAVWVLLLGLWSTYRFARLYYAQETAALATLILGSTQAYFLMTNDVRTDGLLLGWIMFAVWQLHRYVRKGNMLSLILGSLGVGLAMLAKGPIGLILPGIALGSDLLIKRQWRTIFHPQWLRFLLIVGITLIPMSIGLYQQFDLHPEKHVYGLDGPSGLEFFFWTQSFGRISGDIYWDNGAPPYFLFLTMLWDFQPWMLLFIFAWGTAALQLWHIRFKGIEGAEYTSFGVFTLGFIMLSMSNYKLPHYIYPVFPFAAILTANYVMKLSDRYLKPWIGVQWSLMQVMALAVGAYFIWAFPAKSVWLPLLALGMFAGAWVIFLRVKGKARLIWPVVAISGMLNLVAAVDFYPQLLRYQATNQAGHFIRSQKATHDPVYYYEEFGHGLDFYSRRIVPAIEVDRISLYPKGTWIFTSEKGRGLILQQDSSYQVVQRFEDYPVAKLTLPFILEQSRGDKVKTVYLLEKK